jgi:hypothetical protein
MKTQRRRIVIVMLVLCNLLVYAGVIGTAMWNDQRYAEAKSVKWRAWDLWDAERPYTKAFRLVAVARPEVAGLWPFDDINVDNLDIYTRAEYTMKFPPFEEREWGVIYFVPDSSGRTQKVLDRLNEFIAENDEIVLDDSLSYPITVEDVIYNHEAVKALLEQTRSKSRLVLF